jgi:glycine dehydrogenase
MIMLILLKANDNQIKVAVAADILSLVKLTPPGEMVYVVGGTTQISRNTDGYGGPHAAVYFATKEYKRSMPGRIMAYHKIWMVIVHYVWHYKRGNNILKREKATSNICTAQVLLSVMAGMLSPWSERITVHRR